jgi:hypothetical protein
MSDFKFAKLKMRTAWSDGPKTAKKFKGGEHRSLLKRMSDEQVKEAHEDIRECLDIRQDREETSEPGTPESSESS